MSISMEILESLLSKKHYHKGALVDALGLPFIDRKNNVSVAMALLRLIKKNYISKNSNGYKITDTGKAYLKSGSSNLKIFDKSTNKNLPKTQVILFDIPSSSRHVRDWLRSHLKKFNYIMIQKSVWVGPSPLPQEFKKYLKELKLENCIKILTLGKPYTNKTGHL